MSRYTPARWNDPQYADDDPRIEQAEYNRDHPADPSDAWQDGQADNDFYNREPTRY